MYVIPYLIFFSMSFLLAALVTWFSVWLGARLVGSFDVGIGRSLLTSLFSSIIIWSLAYLMIIGTPPNAIVYASGFLTPRDYLRVGVPCFIAALAVLMILCFFYWPLLGFPGLRPM